MKIFNAYFKILDKFVFKSEGLSAPQESTSSAKNHKLGNDWRLTTSKSNSS